MMRRKKCLFALFIALLVLMGVGYGLLRSTAATVPDVDEIREMNPLLASTEYKGKEKVSLPGAVGIMHFFEDDRYLYTVDMSGFIVRIDDRLGQEARYPEQPAADYSLTAAEEKAAALFDDVFSNQEKELGNEKKLDSRGFNGADYLVTIVLMSEGRQTGHKASFSIAGNGQLISAMFIKDTYSEGGDEITEVAAKEAAYAEFAEHYGDDITFVDTSRMISWSWITCERLVHNGTAYWDCVIEAVFADDTSPDGVDRVSYWIRIQAKNGKVVMFSHSQ